MNPSSEKKERQRGAHGPHDVIGATRGIQAKRAASPILGSAVSPWSCNLSEKLEIPTSLMGRNCRRNIGLADDARCSRMRRRNTARRRTPRAGEPNDQPGVRAVGLRPGTAASRGDPIMIVWKQKERRNYTTLMMEKRSETRRTPAENKGCMSGCSPGLLLRGKERLKTSEFQGRRFTKRRLQEGKRFDWLAALAADVCESLQLILVRFFFSFFFLSPVMKGR